MLILLLSIILLTNAAYQVDVLVPLTTATYGATPNFEGLAVDTKSKNLISTRFYNGSLLEINSQNVTEVQIFNTAVIQGFMTGIKVGHLGQRYICLHSANPLHNGVWKFEPGVTGCSSIDGVGCTKLFPRNGENILWPDGIGIRRHGDNYTVFVSDPPSGNIWVFDDKGAQSVGTLFSGTDAGTNPNYLQGIGFLGPPGSEYNPIGRGFGCNGVSFDDKNDVVYTAMAETGLVVSIKASKNNAGNWVAGPQTVIGAFTWQYTLDGVFYDNGVVYATVFFAFSGFNVVPGQKIIALDTRAPTPTWNVIIDNPYIGTPTDVVTGCGYEHPNDNCNKLFITDIGYGSQYGPNILVATPI